MLQYYACLLPLVDISHPHAAVLLFYNITLFQTVSQWRVFLTKPRPLHPQPGAARRPALPGADRKCFVTKLNPIVNYLSPFPPFPLPVAPLLSPYNASLLSLKMYCEAQARVRQGLARDGSQGERPQSFKPCQELTLKLVATTTHHHHHHPPPKSLITPN